MLPIPLAYASAIRERVPGGVLVHGYQPGNARALEELPPHEVAGALGRDERHVDVRRRHDLLVVDREAVAEHQHVAGGDPVLDARLPDLAVQLVGDEHHHDVALAGGVSRLDHAQAVALRRGDAAGLGTQADDDRDAGVLQVQRVGMALRAVADDRDGLAVELA